MNYFIFHTVPDEGSLRLVDGENVYSGRVEIFYNATWFPICQRGWADPDANVACKQLGMEPGSRWEQSLPADSGAQMLLIDVACVGNEKQLSECTLPLTTDTDTCAADETAAVTCTGNTLLY